MLSLLNLNKPKIKGVSRIVFLHLTEVEKRDSQILAQAKPKKEEAEVSTQGQFFQQPMLLDKLKTAFSNKKIEGCYLQAEEKSLALDAIIAVVKEIRLSSKIPIFVSARIENSDQAEKLFVAGVDKLWMILEAVSSDLYKTLKGSSYLDQVSLLTNLSAKYSGKIFTHLTLGMGEHEIDFAETLAYLSHYNIGITLGILIPENISLREKQEKISLETYRKMQILNYLFQHKYIRIEHIKADKGKVLGFKTLPLNLPMEEVFDPHKDILQYRTRHKKVHKPKKNDPQKLLANENLTKQLYQILLDANGKPFQRSDYVEYHDLLEEDDTKVTPYAYTGKMSKKEIETAIQCSGLF